MKRTSNADAREYVDLNRIGWSNEELARFEFFNARAENVVVSVYFRDLEQRLCEEIERADAIVGCVAWLTSEVVLAALARKRAVSILVQKEDFWRPDLASRPEWPSRLRSLYDRLPRGFRDHDFTFRHAGCGEMYEPVDPVRCVGIRRAFGGETTPRMHHKFFVFMRDLPADHRERHGGSEPVYVPYAVWTGSFNPTKNGCASFENALVLNHEPSRFFGADKREIDRAESRQLPKVDLPHAYMHEWSRVFTLSEPLDWESPDVQDSECDP